MQEAGTLDAESKKMESMLKRELKKIKSNLDGIRKMSRLPGVIVAVDVKERTSCARVRHESWAFPTIGIIDTDSNPGYHRCGDPRQRRQYQGG